MNIWKFKKIIEILEEKQETSINDEEKQEQENNQDNNQTENFSEQIKQEETPNQNNEEENLEEQHETEENQEEQKENQTEEDNRDNLDNQEDEENTSEEEQKDDDEEQEKSGEELNEEDQECDQDSVNKNETKQEQESDSKEESNNTNNSSSEESTDDLTSQEENNKEDNNQEKSDIEKQKEELESLKEEIEQHKDELEKYNQEQQEQQEQQEESKEEQKENDNQDFQEKNENEEELDNQEKQEDDYEEKLDEQSDELEEQEQEESEEQEEDKEEYDETNEFLDNLKDLPPFDERETGDGYSINTEDKREVSEIIIKTLINKFLNQRFIKHKTDLNVRSNSLEKSNGFYKWEIQDVIVHLETEQYTKVLTDKYGYDYSNGKNENVPLSFYFDMSGSMSSYTTLLSIIAIELLKKGVKVLVGFNERVNVQIDSVDKNITIEELVEILERAGNLESYNNSLEKYNKVTYKPIKARLDRYLIDKHAEKCVVFADFDPLYQVCNLSNYAEVYYFCFERYISRANLDDFKGFLYPVQNEYDLEQGLIKVNEKRFKSLVYLDNPKVLQRKLGE